MKEDISKINFEKDKYRSLLEQAKKTIEERNRTIGRLENQINEINTKTKKSDALIKKEKE